MINNLIFSLSPILLSLLLGWIVGKTSREALRFRLVSLITILVWLLLISIGFQFGSVLFDRKLGSSILIEAFFYATILSLITFILLFRKNLISNDKKKSLEQIFKPILECLIAIFMVVIGMSLYSILPQNINSELISSILLYILIFLVGVDLSSIKIQFLTLDHIKVPIFTILALFISAYITTFFLEKSFIELVVLGSGFGWFSLSGPLVGKTLGVEQGTFALLVDLVREFYAIGLMCAEKTGGFNLVN